MNRKFAPLLVCLAAAVFLSLTAHGKGGHDEQHHLEDHTHAAHKSHEHGASPLVEEMVVLDTVFREVVSGVAMSDSRRVYGALEKMHGTMEKTHEGVKHGTVTLKKNANRLNEFVEQDKRFHGKLEDLAKAAHRNDSNAMLSLTKELLDRCVKCHREFRKT